MRGEAPLGAPAPSPAGVFGKRLGESSRASVSVDRIGPTQSAIRDDGPARAPALPGYGRRPISNRPRVVTEFRRVENPVVRGAAPLGAPPPSNDGFCRTGCHSGPRASLPARSLSFPCHTPDWETWSWTGAPAWILTGIVPTKTKAVVEGGTGGQGYPRTIVVLGRRPISIRPRVVTEFGREEYPVVRGEAPLGSPAPSPAGFCRTGFHPGPRASLPARPMSVPCHTPDWKT